MTLVTSQQIARFRSQLSHYPEAMTALDAIEDCEGDLEDATMALAIRVGQQPQRDNAEWLDALARKCRAAICQPQLRQTLQADSLAPAFDYFKQSRLIPEILVAPVLMYVTQQGVDYFCQPLDSRF